MAEGAAWPGGQVGSSRGCRTIDHRERSSPLRKRFPANRICLDPTVAEECLHPKEVIA